jgi:hypothetical protein
MKKRLVLKSETMIDLTDTEMSAVAGAQDLSIVCVLKTAVCVSVENCPTGYCTRSLICD